jgi:branched-subunit amino acid ABC-type transport system permease component
VLIERVVGRPMLTSLLATYGVSIILINLGLLLFGADFKSVPVLQGSFLIDELAVSKPRATAGVISLLLTVGVYLFLERSHLGKAIRAVSEHPGGRDRASTSAKSACSPSAWPRLWPAPRA